MSTRIYKPINLNSMSSMSPDIFDRTMPRRPECLKVKRSLFGPLDKDATQRFLDEELAKITVNQSIRYNFDFLNEKPLDPNGNYEWRVATPQKIPRNIKRRPSDEILDFSSLYALPEDDIIRPIPRKPKVEEIKISSPVQRRITDFMAVKKRSTSDFVKKIDRPSDRPSKVPRLNEYS